LAGGVSNVTQIYSFENYGLKAHQTNVQVD